MCLRVCRSIHSVARATTSSSAVVLLIGKTNGKKLRCLLSHIMNQVCHNIHPFSGCNSPCLELRTKNTDGNSCDLCFPTQSSGSFHSLPATAPAWSSGMVVFIPHIHCGKLSGCGVARHPQRALPSRKHLLDALMSTLVQKSRSRSRHPQKTIFFEKSMKNVQHRL